ncbi:hypothetical protein PAPYR_53 [Paratrimastix pyriformis]|uniref:Alpha-galactosidase n=1 Tax=Paratrimastix pyriformis TaxID=342808 RepID=A0ABQ8V192_9EUKA|nr:hypothetical protein PAPYR_53 [Paratrimastix pyriformis]
MSTDRFSAVWEFIQGVDFDGSDICERPDLRDNVEALKAHALTLPNCVGFNTNGWFKFACDESRRNHWTENPSSGFYRLAAVWEFIQGIDYADSDICQRSDLRDNVEGLKAHALTLPNCVGFNTNGWFKSDCNESRRQQWTNKPSRGFYRRVHPWEFLQGIDFDGSDICHRPDLRDNVEALKAHALTLPNCVGFNTNGWFKHTCPEGSRRDWTAGPSCGFYRRV